MTSIAIFGAGNIGLKLANMLMEQYHNVTLYDCTNKHPIVKLFDVAAIDSQHIKEDIIINALPWEFNRRLIDYAVRHDKHYFDFTEDTAEGYVYASSALEGKPNSKVTIVPHCGLAPGLVNILGAHLIKQFDLGLAQHLRLRVGALPVSSTNALRYSTTWSVEGLVNEYIKKSNVIRNKAVDLRTSLDDLEHLVLDGIQFEAFNTYGGIGTMTSSMGLVVDNLDYKTIRYPGHNAVMKMLLDDFGLRWNRDQLKAMISHCCPPNHEDVVYLYVSAIGKINGRLVERSFYKKFNHDPNMGSAIQYTTAGSMAAVLELFLNNQLPTGLVRQEDIDFDRLKDMTHWGGMLFT